MKKIFNLIVFTMVAALTLSTNSFAMDATQKKASLIQMVEKLNLSADQKKQLSQIKSQQTTEYTATFAKVKMINKQLHALSKDKVMDEKKLDILINQKKELLGAIMKRNIIVRQQVTQILNPEQHAQLHRMMKQARGQPS